MTAGTTSPGGGWETFGPHRIPAMLLIILWVFAYGPVGFRQVGYAYGWAGQVACFVGLLAVASRWRR